MLLKLTTIVAAALLWAPAAYAWSWPVQGPVLQPFSFDPAHPYAAGQHRGIDIGAPTGSAVVAPSAGTVTFAGSVPTSGTSLTILTADGYSVTLTHLGTLAVARGATVAEGETMGTVGPSGTSELDVPYLQLGIRVGSDPNGYLDPLTLLPAPGSTPPPSTPGSGAGAGSSAPPVESSPSPPVVSTPATPAPVPVAVPVASAPSAAEPVRPPAVPHADGGAVTPAVHATPAAPAAQAGRPSHAQTRPQTRLPQPVADGVGAPLAHGGWQPPVATEPSFVLRHRPVPVPASSRERPASGAASLPIVPLALGAGAAVLAAALAALLVTVRLRRRPGSPPEAGAVVIPLRRPARQEGRRVA